ncbi:unnamed protein product, partial [Mesorhabditis belari]|uniref:G protein-coupled receptor n=1 Tax=Mesorhabditis belari TaxID=2138241 RepID=A0AAF3EQC4_9BILA
MHVYEYAFVLFPTSFLQYTLTAAHWGMVMYGSLFCQSLVLLAFHFVYRYILICKTNYLYLFNSPKYIPIHFGIWLGMGIIWGTVLHNFMFYTEPYKNYLHDVLWETYEFDVNTSAILGLMYKKRNEDGEEVWDLLELFAFSVCMTELGITFSVISFCTWRIHETLKTAVMSEKARRLQFELFKALLVQTMIPVFFEYIPYQTPRCCI